MPKPFVAITLFLAMFPFLHAAEPVDNAASPYGVCAHLAGGEEHALLPNNLRVMKAGGIDWVRADFSWGGVEPQEGVWKFDHLDRVVEAAAQEGVSVLPILDYDVRWAAPAYKHLDKWTTYVEKVVTRYKDRIRYWEVWNEPNLAGFWHDKPDANNYQLLLDATYKTIKKIDPDLQVVYGGLSQIPLDYIETSLKAGAADSFDVFNIHPYRGGLSSTTAVHRYAEELAGLRELLGKYGAGDKPVWVTEFGWGTPPAESDTQRGIITAAKNVLAPEATRWSVAILHDPAYQTPNSPSRSALRQLLPTDAESRFITLKELETLDPAKDDALLLPPSELCPTPYFAAIHDYVKRGGTLFLLGGIPLYYDTELRDGVLVSKGGAPETSRETLRIGWSAWWHPNANVPKEAALSVVPVAQQAFEGLTIHGKGDRFLNDSRLAQGDRFIPLLLAKEDGFEGVVAAIYKYGGDGKGATVVSTVKMHNVATTVEDQAVYLPQAILLSLQGGIERYFWYEFQAMEQDDADVEHHFGIVHRNLEPKPAYLAYKTLTAARPPGSKPLGAADGRNPEAGQCVLVWKKPDGTRVAAFWNPGGNEATTMQPGGRITKMYDYLGNPVEADGGKFKIGPGIVYVEWEQ